MFRTWSWSLRRDLIARTLIYVWSAADLPGLLISCNVLDFIPGTMFLALVLVWSAVIWAGLPDMFTYLYVIAYASAWCHRLCHLVLASGLVPCL